MSQPSEEFLYDPNLLSKLKLDDWTNVSFNPPIAIDNPGEDLCLRPLKLEDYEKGFPNILSQLTEVGEVSKQQFIETFGEMKKCPNTYYVTVIEDVKTGKVIGSASLLIEQKFIHNCATRARIEDVVVCNNYRGKQLGKLLITVLTMLAKYLGCYKISLDCRDQMISFYETLGFSKELNNGNFMIIRF